VSAQPLSGENDGLSEVAAAALAEGSCAVAQEDLAAALRRAAEAWPSIAVDILEFARHLCRLAARAPPGWLRNAPCGDLLLAFACATGDRGALAVLERQFIGELGAALAAAGVTDAEVPEVLQQVRARVLVGANGEPPRIGGYSGRGPLAGWLKVAAVRVALGERRRRGARPETSVPQPTLEQLAHGVNDPELEYLRERYGAACQGALRSAMSRLDPGQRTLLRLHSVDGLGVEKLGLLHGVHASTISRRLARARADLREEAKQILGESLGLSASEIHSLIRLLRSDLHVSLSTPLNG